MLELILASGSEARKQTLERMGLKFTVVPTNVDERCTHEEPCDYVRDVAKRKLLAAQKMTSNPDAVILASDTMIYFRGEFIGKPSSKADAHKTLMKLAGKTHEVYTGIMLSHNDKIVDDIGIATVTMRKDHYLIEDYLDTNDWEGRAGSYTAFGKGAPLIQAITEDPGTVSGLPIHLLCAMFRKLDINPYHLMKR